MDVISPYKGDQGEWTSILKFLPQVYNEEVSSGSSSSGSTSPTSELSSNSTLQDSFTSSVEENLVTHNLFLSIQDDEPPVVAVLGVGYVGFHLVSAFSQHYKVIAFDLNLARLATVAKQLPGDADIKFTSDESCLSLATHFLVAVPTPLLPNGSGADTSMIRRALETVCRRARTGATIVIESSVSVGMTRSLLGKISQTHNFKAGMSPERVDPGRIDPPFESIPKIISGLDDLAPHSLAAIEKLYSRVFTTIVPVSSPEVAEMTKLYENCQRMICIAYANEMADACCELPTPIDPFEVSRAAATKPFGYLAFSPSAGVGGHCIPVNPAYLFSTSDFPLLKHATEKMSRRPADVADRAMRLLLPKGRDATPRFLHRKPKVLVVGVAFKAGQELVTNSPGIGIITHLLDVWDVHVTFADPLVPETGLKYVPRLEEKTEWNKESLNGFDLIIVVIKQVGLDLGVLTELEGVLVERYHQQ